MQASMQALLCGGRRHPPPAPRRLRPLLELRDKAVRHARSSKHAVRRRVRTMARKAAKGESPLPPLKSSGSAKCELRWDASLTHHYRIGLDGHELTRLAGMHPWAAGPLLPTTGGEVSFVLRILRASDASRCSVGVCDGEARLAWALHAGSGRLVCWSRESNGIVQSRPPPTGDGLPGPSWAESANGRVIVGERERPAAHSTESLAIECVLDQHAGTIFFCVNGGPLHEAMRGLPKGVALRPWLRMMHADDQARLEPSSHELGRSGTGGAWQAGKLASLPLQSCVDRSSDDVPRPVRV